MGKTVADVLNGRGRVALLEGESGVGKTALLKAALAQAEGAQIVWGACDEWGQRFALSAVISALGVRPEAAGPAVDETIEALLQLVERLCAQGPVIFVLDDLQWADEASLAFWRELSRRAESLPLLVAGTRRPLPCRPQLDQLYREVIVRGGWALTLHRLGAGDVAELAARLLGASPGPRLLALLDTAAGNPLYITEMVDVLSQLGILRSGAEGVDLIDDCCVAGVEFDSRGRLSSVIGDRLEALAPGAVDVLRGASVLGVEFTPRELVAVLARPTAGLRVLGDAIAAGLLEQADGVFRFRHALIRDTLYQAMPVGLRTALHRHAAQVLIGSSAPAERIARHLLASRYEAEQWEADWLVEHAAAVTERDPQVAADLIEQVLGGLDPADTRRAALEDRLAWTCFALGRHERAEQVARLILARGADPDRATPAAWILANSLTRLCRYVEALQVLEEIDRRPGIPTLWRARFAAMRAVILPALGLFEQAGAAAQEVLTAGREPGDPVAIGVALYARSVVRAVRHDLLGALDDIERALAAVEHEPELAELRMLLLGSRTTTRFALGHHEGALEAARQALAADRDDSPWLARLRRLMAELLYDLGHWDEAAACLSPSQHLLQHALKALSAGHRDDSAEASLHLRALEAAQSADDALDTAPPYNPRFHALAARVLDGERAAAPPEQNAAPLGVCLEPEAADRFPQRHLVLPLLIRLAVSAGDDRTARAAAEAAAQEARREPTPRKQAAADWCRGLMSGTAMDVLKAADYFRAAGLRLDLGNALEDAAELHARAGDAPAARSTLAAALAVYDELGARWDSRRAAARLRAEGVRLGVRGSRARPGSGLDALTATELWVAGLVAEGCSNPEIAARMLVSRRTVESHVSRILVKLRISSRREIRDLLSQPPREPDPR